MDIIMRIDVENFSSAHRKIANNPNRTGGRPDAIRLTKVETVRVERNACPAVDESFCQCFSTGPDILPIVITVAYGDIIPPAAPGNRQE
jgi:hypothetical protein